MAGGGHARLHHSVHAFVYRYLGFAQSALMATPDGTAHPRSAKFSVQYLCCRPCRGCGHKQPTDITSAVEFDLASAHLFAIAEIPLMRGETNGEPQTDRQAAQNYDSGSDILLIRALRL
jgi:hypothetical protein